MKRTKPKKNRKPLLVMAVVALVAAAGVSGYLWKTKKPTAENSNIGIAQGAGGSINYSPPSADEKNTSDQQKDDIIQNETSPKPPDTSLSVTVSRANQSGKGEPLQVRTIVGGTGSGMCTILLTRVGQAHVSKSVDVAQDANYAVCNTNIDTSEFAQAGEWSLEVTVKRNDGAASPVATQKVTISK